MATEVRNLSNEQSSFKKSLSNRSNTNGDCSIASSSSSSFSSTSSSSHRDKHASINRKSATASDNNESSKNTKKVNGRKQQQQHPKKISSKTEKLNGISPEVKTEPETAAKERQQQQLVDSIEEDGLKQVLDKNVENVENNVKVDDERPLTLENNNSVLNSKSDVKEQESLEANNEESDLGNQSDDSIEEERSIRSANSEANSVRKATSTTGYKNINEENGDEVSPQNDTSESMKTTVELTSSQLSSSNAMNRANNLSPSRSQASSLQNSCLSLNNEKMSPGLAKRVTATAETTASVQPLESSESEQQGYTAGIARGSAQEPTKSATSPSSVSTSSSASASSSKSSASANSKIQSALERNMERLNLKQKSPSASSQFNAKNLSKEDLELFAANNNVYNGLATAGPGSTMPPIGGYITSDSLTVTPDHQLYPINMNFQTSQTPQPQSQQHFQNIHQQQHQQQQQHHNQTNQQMNLNYFYPQTHQLTQQQQAASYYLSRMPIPNQQMPYSIAAPQSNNLNQFSTTTASLQQQQQQLILNNEVLAAGNNGINNAQQKELALLRTQSIGEREMTPDSIDNDLIFSSRPSQQSQIELNSNSKRINKLSSKSSVKSQQQQQVSSKTKSFQSTKQATAAKAGTAMQKNIKTVKSTNGGAESKKPKEALSSSNKRQLVQPGTNANHASTKKSVAKGETVQKLESFNSLLVRKNQDEHKQSSKASESKLQKKKSANSQPQQNSTNKVKNGHEVVSQKPKKKKIPQLIVVNDLKLKKPNRSENETMPRLEEGLSDDELDQINEIVNSRDDHDENEEEYAIDEDEEEDDEEDDEGEDEEEEEEEDDYEEEHIIYNGQGDDQENPLETANTSSINAQKSDFIYQNKSSVTQSNSILRNNKSACKQALAQREETFKKQSKKPTKNTVSFKSSSKSKPANSCSYDTDEETNNLLHNGFVKANNPSLHRFAKASKCGLGENEDEEEDDDEECEIEDIEHEEIDEGEEDEEQDEDEEEEEDDEEENDGPEQSATSYRNKKNGRKQRKNREVNLHKILDPETEVLIEGVLFRAKYLGSTQLVTEGNPTKLTRMLQAQEAVGRIKAPEGESQPSVEVDLFVSTEKIMVLNTDLQEIMMDHSLRSISYIADIGNLVVLMAKRRAVPTPTDNQSTDATYQKQQLQRQVKMICHIFESDEAQMVAQSIGQAFQVAYMEYLKANGIEDMSIMKDLDYQEVLNQQEIMGDELLMFARKDCQKEVIIPKLKNEILGLVIVESGWGSMLPTVVVANMQPSGPAARCGQLNIGDQIISVNGISMVGLQLPACQNQIKSTKHLTLVRLVVVPCPPVVEVLIKRPDTKYQLGFSVQDGIICSLLRGGIAERGGVRVGHRIIEINNQSVVATPHDKIVSMLANSIGELRMKTMPTQMFRLLTGQDQPVYI